MPTANFLLGLEPTEAIAFLNQKKLLASKVFNKAQYDSALAKATTIAKLSNLEMTKDIYTSLETAMREGKGFQQWKKELVAELERKGWVAGHDRAISRGIDGKLLADPKTGEYFGTPRRLETIYRTNMQAAYSAARYQRLRENIDNRPYWQYSAVGDERTRPAHQVLNGKVYRYDDPFWATFYPPNGFNCRCTVIALGERDLKRKGIEQVGDSRPYLIEVKRPVDKQGQQESTIGFRLPDGTVRVTDKGFDYNIGRLTYRPNLDLYPETLAHQFAKAEMAGGEFKQSFRLLSQAVEKFKANHKGKLSAEEMLQVRDALSRNFKFAAGRLNQSDQALTNLKKGTVWLSDDTLIKQFNSRDGQDFGTEYYEKLPELFYSADHILKLKEHNDRVIFLKDDLMAVIKDLGDEIYLLSFRAIKQKEIEKLKSKEIVLR